MNLYERELKALNDWFTSFKSYPIGFKKGSRIYVTTTLNNEPEKELVYCCVDTPDVYKCEILTDALSDYNELIDSEYYELPEYYEIELTTYGFILRHHAITFKGWVAVDYIEDVHFKYEKEVVL